MPQNNHFWPLISHTWPKWTIPRIFAQLLAICDPLPLLFYQSGKQFDSKTKSGPSLDLRCFQRTQELRCCGVHRYHQGFRFGPRPHLPQRFNLAATSQKI